MSAVTLRPARLAGRARAPPSKSYTHRALVAAHLSGGRCVVRRPLVADDTLRTARAMRRLGSAVRFEPESWTVQPSARAFSGARTLDCGESGTSARFLLALAARESIPWKVVGSGRLPERPMGPLASALRSLGAEVRPAGRSAQLPLTVRGPIHGGLVRVDRTESSQFTSALLLVLPTLTPSSRIVLEGRPVSEPYVRATEAVLRERGVRLERRRTGFLVPGGQRYRAGGFEVPGDASSAAYLLAGAAVSGGDVTIASLPRAWPQADLAIVDLLRRFGADVRRTDGSVRVRGGARRAFRFAFDDCPDLYPLAGVLAATAPGTSTLAGGAHVAAKESDRRRETARLARALGARVRLGPARLTIEGRSSPRAFDVRGVSDHRLVMSAAVGALVADGPCRIDDASVVRKSFPSFLATWSALGGEVGAL